MDIVKLKMLEITYHSVNKDLRGLLVFEKGTIKTVKLWSGLNDELKLKNSISMFKKSLKSKIINKYLRIIKFYREKNHSYHCHVTQCMVVTVTTGGMLLLHYRVLERSEKSCEIHMNTWSEQ